MRHAQAGLVHLLVTVESRSRSIVLGPNLGPVRVRPSERSTSSSTSSSSRGVRLVSSAAAFRKRGWST